MSFGATNIKCRFDVGRNKVVWVEATGEALAYVRAATLSAAAQHVARKRHAPVGIKGIRTSQRRKYFYINVRDPLTEQVKTICRKPKDWEDVDARREAVEELEHIMEHGLPDADAGEAGGHPEAMEASASDDNKEDQALGAESGKEDDEALGAKGFDDEQTEALGAKGFDDDQTGEDAADSMRGGA